MTGMSVGWGGIGDLGGVSAGWDNMGNGSHTTLLDVIRRRPLRCPSH